MASKTLQGTVLSKKMDKTITVVVPRRKKHPKYGKYINLSTKYLVHDEKAQTSEGDQVLIQECRPISKRKNWKLVEVMKKGAGK
ncbi:30S ribosomal protein S17 [SAR86 cluster bacterium]|jgi:small subunit ribosomal protein S17|nr:30S ribosomal protein S17 [SAR86 cluster bacterium]|tara:strand:+ start:16364 stop:16615 length:252 start_codon:yes stop_codon:yes gene_type:complete